MRARGRKPISPSPYLTNLEGVLEELRAAGRLREGVEPKELALFILANLQGARLLGKASRDPQVLATCFDLLKGHLSRLFDPGGEETPKDPIGPGEGAR